MTNFRRKPATQFHAFIVEPKPGFKPTNWRQTPTHYRIVRYLGPKEFQGSADTWKFLHNHEAIQAEQVNEWALYLDFDSAIFSAPGEVQTGAIASLVKSDSSSNSASYRH